MKKVRQASLMVSTRARRLSPAPRLCGAASCLPRSAIGQIAQAVGGDGPPGGPIGQKGAYPRRSLGVERTRSGRDTNTRPHGQHSVSICSNARRGPSPRGSRRSALDGTHRQCGRYAPAVRYVFTPLSDPGEHVADRRREPLAAASRRDTRSLRALAMARSESAAVYVGHWASLTPGCGALLGEFELVHGLAL